MPAPAQRPQTPPSGGPPAPVRGRGGPPGPEQTFDNPARNM